VLLLTLGAAVVRHPATATSAVSRTAWDGSLGCTAVGAVAEGGCSAFTYLSFLVSFLIGRHGFGCIQLINLRLK
tara:strand:+ start:119 stop:340 length:222 start_codon:yes stop_codon:yes gene_type:complete